MLHVRLQELFDLRGIGPGAAQERRRLKRALASADGEILRIEHDAREHCLRLHAQDVRLLDLLLEQLRHQLAGRRRIRLVEAHGRVGDIGRRTAVVVDDRHAGAGFEQVAVFHLIRAVGVYHDEQRAAVGMQIRLLRRQERFAVLRHAQHPVTQLAGGRLVRIHDDAAGRAELARDAADAGGRAERVQIGEFMAHDVDLGRVLNELAEGVGHDAGLDLRAPLDLAAAAAEEFERDAVFHHGLVAAARERHLGAENGEIIAFIEAVAVAPDADADGGADAARAGHGVHAVEQGCELVLAQLVKMPLLEHVQIPVTVVAAEEAALALAPLQELVLNGVAQLVALAVGQAADELIVVIDDDDGDNRARSVILQPDLFIIRDIDPVGDAHVAGGIVRIRAHEVAVDLILMALILQQLRALGIALEQPAAGKLRDHVRDAHIDRRLVPAAEIEKVLVGPDDLRICRTKDRHRQREILQGIISCRLRIIGDGFNISFERAALARAHDDRINDEQQNDDALADRQPEPVGEEERDDCKHDQKQQKHPRIGHQRPLQLGFIGYIADFGVSHRHTSLHPAGQKLLPL